MAGRRGDSEDISAIAENYRETEKLLAAHIAECVVLRKRSEEKLDSLCLGVRELRRILYYGLGIMALLQIFGGAQTIKILAGHYGITLP